MQREQQELAFLIESRFPIITVETMEEPRFAQLIERVANLAQQPLISWTATQGLKRVAGAAGQRIAETGTSDLMEAIRYVWKTPSLGIYVFYDAHPFMDSPAIQRAIKEVALDYPQAARTLVFCGPEHRLSADLQRMSAAFRLSLPTTEELMQIVKDEAHFWTTRNDGTAVKGSQDALTQLVQHLVGLTRDDARRLVRQTLEADGAITFDDVRRVLKHKHHALGADSALEVEASSAKLDDVGGLNNLKKWLELRRDVFAGVRDAQHLDCPKGLLLLGVQGGGKSLAAKAVAGSWNLPLLRLDFGALYGKYHGESERNMRNALSTAEAMAPCVLWLDEVEKGLSVASAGSDDGVSRRLLGSFLTWLAERSARVFVVGTANDVTTLAPELLRKGRFDEVFFVDLPDQAARAQILAIHLRKRKHEPVQFDIDAIAACTEGFSGAELEQLIVAAGFEAYANKTQLGSELLIAAAAQTKPLSVLRAEAMQDLRDWASGRTVSAS
jgi:SpoVK/Ycf46/Vps4 family AAA+-type ATPase